MQGLSHNERRSSGKLRKYIRHHLGKGSAWNTKTDWDSIKPERALKLVYDPAACSWSEETELEVKLESEPFARGAMRQCFRMKKIDRRFTGQTWQKASPYVAKSYLDPHIAADESGAVYKDDVVLQTECASWAKKFNEHQPPKKCTFVFVWLIKLVDRPGQPLMHVERFIEGDYVKYNSNGGFVDDGITEDGKGTTAQGYLRSTPQAFSHFTYQASGKRLMVVDMQGVGDLLTDPQM